MKNKKAKAEPALEVKTTFEWRCPECAAPANKHGEGGVKKCLAPRSTFLEGQCGGFICNCLDDIDDAHGLSYSDPCHEAECHHCGWMGAFPPKPKGLPKWAEQALEAGWTPPKGWKP